MVQVLDLLLSDADVEYAQIVDQNGSVIVASDPSKTGLAARQELRESDLRVPVANLGYLEVSIARIV